MPAFVPIVMLHVSLDGDGTVVALAAGVGPLYVAVIVAASQGFSDVPAAGRATVHCAPHVLDALVTVSGAAPPFTTRRFCGADGVTVAGLVSVVTFGVTVVSVVNVAAVNFAENVVNAAGLSIRIGVAGGSTTRPLVKVSVQLVVMLVYVTSNAVGIGAVAPGAPVQDCVLNVRPIVGTMAVNVVTPVV